MAKTSDKELYSETSKKVISKELTQKRNNSQIGHI